MRCNIYVYVVYWQTRCCKSISSDECEAVVNMLDLDGSDKIGWEDFRRLYALVVDDEAMQRLETPARAALRKASIHIF